MGTGVLVIANLAPELFSGLGFSVTLQLGLSVVWVVCAAIGATINSLLLDKFGRIKLFGKFLKIHLHFAYANVDSCRWLCGHDDTHC
jgi:hypothetical protein